MYINIVLLIIIIIGGVGCNKRPMPAVRDADLIKQPVEFIRSKEFRKLAKPF